MVVGDVPFPADSASVVLTKALTETPPSPRTRNALVSDPVAALIMKMMARDRDKRHQDAESLMAALEALPRDPGVAMGPPTKGASVVFPTRRTSTAAVRRLRRRHR
jgi:serine/threonine protein kinase